METGGLSGIRLVFFCLFVFCFFFNSVFISQRQLCVMDVNMSV